MKLVKTHVSKGSINVILTTIAITAVINIMSALGVLDITRYISMILTVGGSLFLMTEVAFLRGNHKGAKKVVDIVIMITAALALLSVAAESMGWIFMQTKGIQAIVNIAFLVAVVTEIFRKN